MGRGAPAPKTPEETAALEAQVRFLDSLGLNAPSLASLLNPADAIADGVTLSAIKEEMAEGKSDTLRAHIGTKKPEELLTAFEAMDPKTKDFFDTVRANPALAESIHKAVVNDPSVLKGLEGAGAEGGLDMAKLQTLVKEGSLNSTFTALFNKIAESPDDDITFDTVTGLMVKLDEKGLDAVNDDLKGMDIAEIKITGTLAAAMMTPKELLERIGKEAGIEIPEAALADEAFQTALHEAVAKDPTVLEGMMNLKDPSGKDIEGFNPTDLQAMLADNRNRGVLTGVLGVVANNPDPKFNFKYMTDFAKDVQEGDMSKVAARFREMDLKMPDATPEDMIKFLGQYLNDPVGSSKTIVEMMGIDPASAKGLAMTNLLGTMGSFLEMIIGGETGYRAVFNHYMPGLVRDGTKLVDDLSGKTDAEAITAGLEESHDGMRDRGLPAAGAETASLDTPPETPAAGEVKKVAYVDPDTLIPSERAIYNIVGIMPAAGEGSLGSALNVGPGSVLTAALTFKDSAMGIVPADKTAEFGEEMYRRQANLNGGMSLTA